MAGGGGAMKSKKRRTIPLSKHRRIRMNVYLFPKFDMNFAHGEDFKIPDTIKLSNIGAVTK